MHIQDINKVITLMINTTAYNIILSPVSGFITLELLLLFELLLDFLETLNVVLAVPPSSNKTLKL